MTIREQTFLWISLLFVSLGGAVGVVRASDAHLPFSVASIHFEQNVTDRDVEVVFEIKGSDKGMKRLVVTSPDGRPVIDFTVSTLGIRKFLFETPEPKDIESLKVAYPQGVYTFTGLNSTGDKLRGESTLHHTFPATVSTIRPEADARGVGTQNLEITWIPVKDAAAYLLEIEHEETKINVKAKLPGSANVFSVPVGFLLPGSEYKLSIGTLSEDGNVSVVESTFTTAGK